MALGLGAAGLMGGILGLWGIFLIVAILATVFWIVEIIDVVRREFSDPILKVVWLLVVIFLHLLGAILYYFIGKNQGRIPGQTY